MKFWDRVPCFLATAAVMLAQGAAVQYQPAVPAGDTIAVGGFFPGSCGASTAAGSALNGMASAISAMGNYNLSTSAAAVNMTQARRNAIENSALYTDTFFQMRAANRAHRAAEARPRPTAEQVARRARDAAPGRSAQATSTPSAAASTGRRCYSRRALLTIVPLWSSSPRRWPPTVPWACTTRWPPARRSKPCLPTSSRKSERFHPRNTWLPEASCAA